MSTSDQCLRSKSRVNLLWRTCWVAFPNDDVRVDVRVHKVAVRRPSDSSSDAHQTVLLRVLEDRVRRRVDLDARTANHVSNGTIRSSTTAHDSRPARRVWSCWS